MEEVQEVRAVQGEAVPVEAALLPVLMAQLTEAAAAAAQEEIVTLVTPN